MKINNIIAFSGRTKKAFYGFPIILLLLINSLFSSCEKIEYNTVENPAYIRVFNNMTYTLTLQNKDEPQPFFCMFIDPEFDETGKPISGLVVGDHLDKRNLYAAPNAAHAGLSTSKFNPEYPGKELVPTAPILNGFDLTNWAQIPAGKRRFLFMARPISAIPFSQLPDEQQRIIFLDTTIDLSEREVYTLHILQKDFKTKKNGLYVRQENFHKQPFSDTISYVNFYNLSAKGFVGAGDIFKTPVPFPNESFQYGIVDTVNVFLSIIEPGLDNTGKTVHTRLPNFSYQFAGTVYNTVNDPKVSKYYGFPVIQNIKNKIFNDTWQYIQFCSPPIDPKTSSIIPEVPDHSYLSHPYKSYLGNYAFIKLDNNQYKPSDNRNTFLPGLTAQVHSGINNPKSMSLISSIEIVNGHVFLTSIQRKFPQPIY
ncbi:hypothetical protein ACP6L2_06755 [Sphingobacterium lactis]|uniref:hypothetical protein n=1 Tax=Sphingobacterium lactis TaxID=797291 RepID=UPI003F7F795B